MWENLLLLGSSSYIALWVSVLKNAVLLDHGIYTELDEMFRINYCQLWKALILQDPQKIRQLGEQLGVGKYSKYLPVIFTGRTMERCASYLIAYPFCPFDDTKYCFICGCEHPILPSLDLTIEVRLYWILLSAHFQAETV